MRKLEDLSKEELLEIIYELTEEFRLWRCRKCGKLNKRELICGNCRFDPTKGEE